MGFREVLAPDLELFASQVRIVGKRSSTEQRALDTPGRTCSDGVS